MQSAAAVPRQRKKSRRWHAIRTAGVDWKTKIKNEPKANSIEFRPPKELGLWAIDVANPNSWGSACDRIFHRSAADVAVVAETKATTRTKGAAWDRAHGLGWNATLGDAMATGTSSSGGNAVAVRRGIGICGIEVGGARACCTACIQRGLAP